MWENSMKPFVVLKEAACDLINCLQCSCIKGNCRRQVLRSSPLVCMTPLYQLRTHYGQFYTQMIKVETAEPEISPFFYSNTRDTKTFLFKPWSQHYPQCNSATEWHHWMQFTRWYAASSGATTDFILSFLWRFSWNYNFLVSFLCVMYSSNLSLQWWFMAWTALYTRIYSV